VLRDAIASHAIAPGNRLREQQLVDEHKTPRAKVREVLAGLEQRGLVERIPSRGAIVVKLDTDQVCEIYAVREVLEGLMACLACEKTKPEYWQDHLDEFEGPMRRHIESHDFEAFLVGYEKFRRRLLAGAANRRLEKSIESITAVRSKVEQNQLVRRG